MNGFMLEWIKVKKTMLPFIGCLMLYYLTQTFGTKYDLKKKLIWPYKVMVVIVNNEAYNITFLDVQFTLHEILQRSTWIF